MSNRRYGLEETELEKLNIRLLYITQARYDTDWHSIAHTHHFTELFYVVQGSGYFLVEDKNFRSKKMTSSSSTQMFLIQSWAAKADHLSISHLESTA